ncbi:MAG TPA: hypothetical protein VF242_06860 [Nitrososphaeraceae archaeon]
MFCKLIIIIGFAAGTAVLLFVIGLPLDLLGQMCFFFVNTSRYAFSEVSQ